MVQGKSFILEKGNKKIIIDYDKEVNKELYGKEEGFKFANNDYRRPDFLISYYDNNNFISALIFEAKCSLIKNIIENDEWQKTRSEKQLDGYTTLRYWDDKSGWKENATEKVILLYPKQKTEITKALLTKKKLTHISHVGLGIKENLKETDGYNILYETIKHFLEKTL